jgi:hypothetical protein
VPRPASLRSLKQLLHARWEILLILNDEICRDSDSCMFVTFFCGILNIRIGQVDYSN